MVYWFFCSLSQKFLAIDGMRFACIKASDTGIDS